MKNKIPFYTIETLKSSVPRLKDINFYRLEDFFENIDHLKEPHRHSFYTFILISEGTGKQEIDFIRYRLVKQRLFLIAPGQIHTWNTIHSVKGYIFLFNDNFMALSKSKNLLSDWPLFKIYQPCFSDLDFKEYTIWRNEFERINHEIKNMDIFSKDAIYYTICTLMVRACRLFRHSTGSNVITGSDILYDFQELIDKNFIDLKTPKEYASKLNITPNYLNALCKQKAGKSAGELIRQRIVLEAKRLLVHTDMSIAEISDRLDFKDNSYFGKFFKKNVQLTPADFRIKNKHTITR